MKIVINNVGTIDLGKQLYVFSGYNGTGKTKFAKLIHDLFLPENVEKINQYEYVFDKIITIREICEIPNLFVLYNSKKELDSQYIPFFISSDKMKLDVSGLYKKETGYYTDLLNELSEIPGYDSENNPIYQYLKYIAKKENNFLIIDDFGNNLDPNNQKLMTDLLMKFLSKNNKLLLVTHIPLILEHINNYLVFSNLSLKNKNEVCDISDFKLKLDKSNTGIYFFNKDKIQEMDIGPYGALSLFKQEMDNIYHISSDLSELMWTQINK